MKTFLYIFCLLPLVPSTVLARAPNLGRRKSHDCLTDGRATAIAETWCQLNIVFDEVVANATLAEDFELFSDSENWIGYAGPTGGLADIKGDKVGSTGFEYLVTDPDTGLIKTAYREFNSLEFVYEVGQYICFQRHNRTRCAP